MKIFENPTMDIVLFDAKDIITTSNEHDNGFVDIGDLLKKLLK